MATETVCFSVRCLSVMDAVASSPGSYDQFVLVSPASAM